MNSTTGPIIPKWLKRLQENSWEMEILISGGAIFSLFQLSDYYIDWIQQIRMTAHLPGAGILLILGMFGIKILTLGFILHLVSRGFWLSLVCLNDVYPEGLKANKIGWKLPYRPKVDKEPHLKEQIIKVDKTCGTIMYLSIVAAFAIIGLALTVILWFALLYIFEDYVIFDLLASTFFIIFMAYLFDLLSFGILRKVPILSYLTFPVFRFFDLISLRNYYQKSLWIFNTNIKKLKFSLLALVFLMVAFALTFNALYRVMHWPNILDSRIYRYQTAFDHSLADLHYMDNWDVNRSASFGIGSKIIKGNYLEVYMRYDKDFDILIDSSDLVDDKRSFSKIVQVLIDSQKVGSVNWLPARKTNGDYGIGSMISVKHLSEGRHDITLTVKEEYADLHDLYLNRPKLINIPFWIDRPSATILVKEEGEE